MSSRPWGGVATGESHVRKRRSAVPARAALGESALAIGAVIIAAVSLWVAVDTERTNRELVASASWPFVQFYNDRSVGVEPPVLTFLLSNAGIGPAKLESFELFWKGRPQRSPWLLLQTCCAQGGTAAGKPGSLEVIHQTSGLETQASRASCCAPARRFRF